MKSEIIFYAAMSVDGYIAGPESKELTWLDHFNEEIEKLPENDVIRNSYKNFTKDIDIYVMGRKTYEIVRDMSEEYFYDNVTNYVVTHNPNDYKDDNVTKFITYEELKEILNRENNKVYIIGGGLLFAKLLEEEYINKIIITQIPILLGEGIKYFQNTNSVYLKLTRVDHSKDFVELEYIVQNKKELKE